MKQPSRLMPPVEQTRGSIVLSYGLLAGVAGGYGWLCWRWPVATLASTVALALWWTMESRKRRRHFEALERQRTSESICTFARALPMRQMDPWVVRATFEAIQAHLRDSIRQRPFPLRPSDRLVEDLRIEPDDLDLDLVDLIARRAGRDLSACRENPYFGRVATVEHLIRFLCAQPASSN